MEIAAKLALGVPFAAAIALFGFRAWEHRDAPPPSVVITSTSSRTGSLSGRAVIIDGDTIRLGGRRVRLFGIDAPERHQTCQRGSLQYACGVAATEALRDLIGPGGVTCKQRDTDKYGRAVAVCRGASGDLGASMVRSGWAVAYRRYSLDYTEQEDEAHRGRRGIWAGDFIAPSDWRHQN